MVEEINSPLSGNMFFERRGERRAINPLLPETVQDLPNVQKVWEDAFGRFLILDAIKAKKNYNELAQLTEAYLAKLESDENKTKATIQSISKDRAEQKYNDAQRHFNHLSILPPSDFADTPQLENKYSRSSVLAYFPTHSFSGEDKRGLSIENLLERATRAQQKFRLEQSEFLHCLENCVTGTPAQMLSQWIQSGYTVPEIYEKLLSLYGTHLRPDEAMNKLLNYTIPPNTKGLHSVIQEIEKLAMMASSNTLSTNLRTKQRNSLCIDTLTRCLPPHCKILLQDKLNALRTELEEIRNIKLARGETLTPLEEDLNPSFLSICRALNHLQPQVDNEICAVSSKYRVNKTFTPNVKPLNRYNKGKPNPFRNNSTHNVFSLDQCNLNPRISELKSNPIKPSQFRPPNYPSKYQDHSPSDKYQKGQSQLHQKSVTRHPFCSLCGGNNHIASQGCKAIMDDEGKILKPNYCFTYCEPCYINRNIRLNHITAHCPGREAMINLYKSGKVIPSGIFYKFFNHLIPNSNKTNESRKYTNKIDNRREKRPRD